MSEVWRRYIHIAVEAQLRDTYTPAAAAVVLLLLLLRVVVSELAI